MANEPDVKAVARSFLTEIAARAEAIERERRMPADLARRMAQAGLFNMLVPARYGGGETDPQTLFDTIETVARADGAVGWCLMIGATTGLMAASLSHTWAQAIYGDNPTGITCGVTAPLGQAQPARGGVSRYRPLAVWQRQRRGRLDLWWQHLHGQRRTANKRIRSTRDGFDVLPPRRRHHSRQLACLRVARHRQQRHRGDQSVRAGGALGPCLASVPGSMRRSIDSPRWGLLALGVSAVAVGIAQHAIDSFMALATAKVPTGSRRPLAQRASAQQDLAMAQATLQSGRALTRETVDRAWQAAHDGAPLPREIKAELRLAATNNTWSAVAAVDRLYHAAGGSSVYATSDLQRCFRDVHVTTQHIMVAQPTLRGRGQGGTWHRPKNAVVAACRLEPSQATVSSWPRTASARHTLSASPPPGSTMCSLPTTSVSTSARVWTA